MKEERVVLLRIFDQPLHCTQDIRLGRNAHGMLLVVGENNHVLPPIPVPLMEENRHVGDIVDASTKLIRLSDIVDSDQ
jgi:hypothetical protein